MRSCLVEVAHIGIEHALELLLLQDQQVVQAFLPHTPQKSLTDGIGSWGMIGRFEDLNAARCGHVGETGAKFGIIIPNQVLGCLSIRGGFPYLLCCPSIRGRPCHADMDHPSRFQFYYEEGKERPKEQIGDLEEVAGPDLCGVSAEKRAPLLLSWLLCANRPHVLLNGALTHPKAQFQELSTNPFSTPESIFFRHFSDQGDGFGGDPGLVRRGP